MIPAAKDRRIIQRVHSFTEQQIRTLQRSGVSSNIKHKPGLPIARLGNF